MAEMIINQEEDHQYARNRNLIIEGIPDANNENVLDIIIILGKAVQMELQQKDIQACHRLNSKLNSKKPIVAQFDNRLVRDEFLSKCKARRVSTDVLNSNLNPEPIYVNPHLTPYFKNLRFEAKNKTVNGQKLFKYVWFKNSKLFARKSDNGPVVRITCMEDIK